MLTQQQLCSSDSIFTNSYGTICTTRNEKRLIANGHRRIFSYYQPLSRKTATIATTNNARFKSLLYQQVAQGNQKRCLAGASDRNIADNVETDKAVNSILIILMVSLTLPRLEFDIGDCKR